MCECPEILFTDACSLFLSSLVGGGRRENGGTKAPLIFTEKHSQTKFTTHQFDNHCSEPAVKKLNSGHVHAPLTPPTHLSPTPTPSVPNISCLLSSKNHTETGFSSLRMHTTSLTSPVFDVDWNIAFIHTLEWNKTSPLYGKFIIPVHITRLLSQFLRERKTQATTIDSICTAVPGNACSSKKKKEKNHKLFIAAGQETQYVSDWKRNNLYFLAVTMGTIAIQKTR